MAYQPYILEDPAIPDKSWVPGLDPELEVQDTLSSWQTVPPLDPLLSNKPVQKYVSEAERLFFSPPKPSQQPMQRFGPDLPEGQFFSQPFVSEADGGHPLYRYPSDEGLGASVKDEYFGSPVNVGEPSKDSEFQMGTSDLFDADADAVGDIDQDSVIGADDDNDVEYTPKSTRSRKHAVSTLKTLPPSKRARTKVTASKVSKSQHQRKACDHAPFKDASELQRHTANAHTRAFICVFAFAGCHSTFASKNEWKRHVSSQHLNLSTWVCELQACSKVLSTPKTGGPPTKGSEFNRKDFFTHHLRRMHAPFAVKRMQKKNPEWEKKLKELAVSCLRVKRLPPTRLLCPVRTCGTVFEGQSCWDDRMEHVGKHLEQAAASSRQYQNEVRQEDDKLLVQWALREGIVEVRGNGYQLCKGGRDRVEVEEMDDEDMDESKDYTNLHQNTKIERTSQHQAANQLEVLTENRVSMARDDHMTRSDNTRPYELGPCESPRALGLDSGGVSFSQTDQHSGGSNNSCIDEKLSTIRNFMASHLLHFPGCLHYVAIFEMDWDLPNFMRTQYNVDKNVNLESVITISGTALYCQATTSVEYLRQNWPDYGCEMLEILQAALDSPQLTAKGLLIYLPYALGGALGCSTWPSQPRKWLQTVLTPFSDTN
jgi:hypothetical protein